MTNEELKLFHSKLAFAEVGKCIGILSTNTAIDIKELNMFVHASAEGYVTFKRNNVLCMAFLTEKGFEFMSTYAAFVKL